MEEDTVHPEVRAHIDSLVSALGGVSNDDDEYQLGDDALEVLRDVKRWIRFYDDKTSRMDVARCLREANIVEGDLLPILAMWREKAAESKMKARLALACLEILVPLTWPIERDKERMTVNHYRHMPVLELAQLQYKKVILSFDRAQILQTAIRIAVPSIALPIGDRTPRDQGTIKLVLFFIRNMAMISSSGNKNGEDIDGEVSQISRSSTLDAFSQQGIFLFLLTISSGMGEEYRTEDTTVMEILYHLVKGVDVDQLFMHDKEVNKAKAKELSVLMEKESKTLNTHSRKGHARHSRFGTMIWVTRQDNKMSSLSGQDVLLDKTARNQKIDNDKVFRPPRRSKKPNGDERDLAPPAKLDTRARTQLREFVQDFLDSGFNKLFQHVRRSMEREASHVMQYHRRQFFYLVSWFLQAERARRLRNGKAASSGEVDSFSLVAGVLNQEMFIKLNGALHESYEMKDWRELTAVMRCFTQILLTIQQMADCGREDDEEVAENLLNRIFYQESTYDAIVNIAKSYKDQGFDFLDAATELVHYFVRILEAYSKQNVDLQIRSRQRARRNKEAREQQGDDDDGSGDDETAARKTCKERKFDFQRFSSKFTTQGVADTYVTFTKFYADLNDEQLKRAHRYFHRLAFKQQMSVMLFRLDIIHLFYNIIMGPEPLSKSSKMFGEWKELVKHLLRKCFKKMNQRPQLLTELLFSKIQATALFLETGHEVQTVTAKRPAKPGAELEFRYTEERDRQIAIVVGALLERNEADHINWLKGVITDAESERRCWAAAQEAISEPIEDERPVEVTEPKRPPLINVRHDSAARRTAMFKNSHLRLLMTVSGLRRLGPVSEETVESCWIIPEDVTAQHLADTLHYINQAEFGPPTFENDASAVSQLRRKPAPRKKAVYDDDEDDENATDNDESLFPIGGPTTRKAIDKPDRPRKIRRRRRRSSKDNVSEPDDSAVDEARRKRSEREREKARRIKSALYVREGDDDFNSEEDEAFFARERAIADRARMAAESATTGGVMKKTEKRKRKRKADADADADDDAVPADSDEETPGKKPKSDTGSRLAPTQIPTPNPRKPSPFKKQKPTLPSLTLTDDDEADANDSKDRLSRQSAPERTETKVNANDDDDDDDDEDAAIVSRRRPRIRGGFVVSSDEE
ncbi:Topoisomerase 1-associated factor 1 [Ophiocordyceps camponoti-floridani]|uniref:Topoisomerase 1-associated factor 1 n=1 Tax=Ophiocordyceps camponoti-floridani TaxID=2030778 RepID=A0A8H4VGL2_9HYPO|nr:Topoisomerase 1-associated factor 1 [Ophiocordyceps camponoti-floridani]